MRQVFLRLAKVSRPRRPSSLRVPQTCLHGKRAYGPIFYGLHAFPHVLGKEVEMKRPVLLILMVLACSRTSLGLHVSDGGSPGLGGAVGGMMVLPTSGGSSGNGGAGGVVSPSGSGGLVTIAGKGGVGGTPATGGVSGTGGSTSASGGSISTADLDICSSDADCLSLCIWVTAPKARASARPSIAVA